ncbi:hypothetical protein V2J09_009759 [Rumex salicifolius]
MFWRERERENKEKNEGPHCGQIRVLVVGDSGVGKTSLVHLIMKGCSISRPPQTIGCSVSVKHTTYGSSGSSSNSTKGDAERDFFIELWDICGHDRYKDCRSLFYSQINGVIFVYDLSQRGTKSGLINWASEIAATGNFSAPMGSSGPGGLPVPYIVIKNKADIITKEGRRGSSGNLVDVARQWVKKQGLLPPSEELPLVDSFPGNTGLLAAAREARYDKEAVFKFFHMLIRRRYYSDELPSSIHSPWTISPLQKPAERLDEIIGDEGQLYGNTSTNGESNNNNNNNKLYSPLPAQHSLTPPPTLYPQRPVLTPDANNIPRFNVMAASDFTYMRPKRTDINV